VTQHEHSWQNGAVTRKEATSRSPYSTDDDHIWEWIVQHQTCACGATRQLVLGYENRRRRGDDYRRRRGLDPLGAPLQRSETYDPPRRFRDA
jgi:hypothetical protein